MRSEQFVKLSSIFGANGGQLFKLLSHRHQFIDTWLYDRNMTVPLNYNRKHACVLRTVVKSQILIWPFLRLCGYAAMYTTRCIQAYTRRHIN